MVRQLRVQTLGKACKLTGSRWAMALGCEDNQWNIEAAFGFNGSRENIFAARELTDWMASALASGRTRTRKVDTSQWGVSKIFAFPLLSQNVVVVVGADRLSNDQKGIFRLLEGVFHNPNRSKPILNGQDEGEPPIDQQLIQAARLAAVGEMAAGVAHELNNPLTTIAGFAELILEDMPEDAAPREDLELILKEALRAREVVRRLLNFSRKGEHIKVQTNVNEMVGEILAIVNHHARTGGIDMHFTPWTDLPAIFIDRNQIKQVVLNLVHNAVQAMPRGGNLKLETVFESKEGKDWIVISVLDSGVGIPDEHIGRLFEPFFTTKPTGIGTGLGLSISYRIVSDHGGFIDVKSRFKEGSRFSIWLPMEAE